jgi:phospholipid transport system substrate-binding protein
MVHSQFMKVNPPQPIKVDWRLAQSDQGLRIVDVIVEGVSLTVTQRSDFASVIQRNGGKISALLDTLRTKSKELSSNT